MSTTILPNGAPIAAVPEALRQRPQWVLWRVDVKNNKPTKVPYTDLNRKASANTPRTWLPFDEALHRWEANPNGWAGIGYEFSDDDPYTGVDLDNCLDPASGVVEPWADRELGELLPTYAEISPSGKGIKLWVETSQAHTLGSDDKDAGQIEVYSAGRFFAVTGRVFEGAPSAIARVDDDLVEQIIARENERRAARRPKAVTNGAHPNGTNGAHPTISLAGLVGVLNQLNDGRWAAYDDWLRIGMSLHDWAGGDPHRPATAYALYDQYSKERAPASYGETAEKWASFGKRNGDARLCTAGTLIEWIKADNAGEPPHPAERTDDMPHAADIADDVPNPPFRIYRGDAIDHIAAPRQLVRGYLAIGTVALLVAPSEAGKSTVAVDLAQKVAQHYGVIYVAGEDGANVRAQVRAWELMHKRARSQQIAIVDGPVQLQKDDQVATFIAAARVMAPRLIIFDTLSACTPGVDENSSEISRAIYNLNCIADELQAAVLVLHHPLKYDNGTFRGHSSILNDTHTMIIAHRDEGDDIVTLTVTRHKGPRAAPATLRILTRETDIIDPDDGPLSAPVVVPAAKVIINDDHLSMREKAILQYLADVDADGGATAAEICREIAARFHVTEGGVRKHIARLVRLNLMTPGAKQRDPRVITTEGSRRIGLDQVDQVDQVVPSEPFVVNAKLNENAPAEPTRSEPDPQTTQQQDAEYAEPDPTRSIPDPSTMDQVPSHARKPDPPDPVLYTGSGGSGFAEGGKLNGSKDTKEKRDPCNHTSCRKAGLPYCGHPSGPGQDGDCDVLPGDLAAPEWDIARLMSQLRARTAEGADEDVT